MKKILLTFTIILLLSLMGCTDKIRYYENLDFKIQIPDGWYIENKDKISDDAVFLMVTRDIENNNYGSINISVDDLDSEADIDEQWFFESNMKNISGINSYSLLDEDTISLGEDDAKLHTFFLTPNDEKNKYMQIYLFAEDLKKGYVLTGTFSDIDNDIKFIELKDLMSTFELKRLENK